MAINTIALYLTENGYLLCARHAERWRNPSGNAKGVKSRLAVMGLDCAVSDDCVDCTVEAER